MIGRIWTARTRTGADAYTDVFRGEVAAELAAQAGFRGAYLLRRELAGGTELMALTLFASFADVGGFAGADLDRANVSAAARAVLDDVDERVRHFTVAVRIDPGESACPDRGTL